MNIFTFELKKYLKSVLIWSISIVALVIMFMSFYPSFAKDATLMEKILENYPEEMLKAFGMDSEVSLSTVLGYFTFVFAFIQLVIAMQASNYGFAFLSIEERELTADFLLTKPVSRTDIIISKVLAVLSALLITDILIAIGIFMSVGLFNGGNPYDNSIVLLLILTIPLFQLFFISIGMLISVSIRKVKNVLSFSVGISFALYILNALKNIIGGDLLGFITPFHYFDSIYIVKNGSFDYSMLYVDLAIVVVSISVAYYRYLKRDIYSL